MMKYSVAVIAALALTGCKDSAEQSTKKSFDKYTKDYAAATFKSEDAEKVASKDDAAKVTKVDNGLFKDMDKGFSATNKWIVDMNKKYTCTIETTEEVADESEGAAEGAKKTVTKTQKDTFPIGCKETDGDKTKDVAKDNKDIKEGQELLDSAKAMDAARTVAWTSVISKDSGVEAVTEIGVAFGKWADEQYKDLAKDAEKNKDKLKAIAENIAAFTKYINFARAHGADAKKADSKKE